MRRPIEDEVLRLLSAESTGLPARDILRHLKPPISQPTLWRLLDRLRSEGVVIVEGRGRATRYHAGEGTDRSVVRSRRLHAAVAHRLARDPSLVDLAKQRLLKLRQVNPHGGVYHDRWSALLEGPLERLLGTMTEPSEQADTLRRESPFGVLVTAAERRRVFASVRAA